jgi:hypothetical protein
MASNRTGTDLHVTISVSPGPEGTQTAMQNSDIYIRKTWNIASAR